MTQPSSHKQPPRTPSRARHMRRLLAVEFARRSIRKARQASRGQTLIIFALTFTVLIGFMGLAIDTVRIYDLYARMQRAAESGALAGVIYMPDFYTTDITTSPGDNAVCRAWKEVYKNSFGPGCTDPSAIGSNYCPTPLSSVEVAVCPVPNQQHELSVTITESIDVLFLSALNVGPLTISATATAAYTPPISLAVDPSNPGGTGTWGTFGSCSGASGACTGNGPRQWGANINGPAELKEQGDPFVTCEEGNAHLQTPDSGAASYSAYPYTTDTGLLTNHPIYSQSVGTPPANCTNALSEPNAGSGAYLTANPDSASQPFTGAIYNDGTQNPPTHQGYAYYVHVNTDQSSIYVWNAPFVPQAPGTCNGRTKSYDTFFAQCPSGAYTAYPGSDYATKGLLDPKLYYTVTYSIYLLNNGPADPYTQTYEGSFTALPYASASGCTTELLPSVKYGITTPQCVATPACYETWCPIGNQVGDATGAPTPIKLLAGQDYRVVVVAASYYDQGFDLGWGSHVYSLEVCPPLPAAQPCSSATNPAGQIVAWSTMDALFLFPGNGGGVAQATQFPLGVFSSALAGRTVDIGFFDLGDLYGTNGNTTKASSAFTVLPNLPGQKDPCSEPISALQAAGYDTTVNGKTFTYPAWEVGIASGDGAGPVSTVVNSAPAYPGIISMQGGDRAFNGLWVDEYVTFPSNYTTSLPWTICAWAPQSNDSDIVGITATALGQSPVHLIQ